MGIILVAHSVLLGWNATLMSPTLDEPAHLVSGISHWRSGDFSLYRVNPPLVRLVATIPSILCGYTFDFPEVLNDQFSRNEFRLGEQFVTENRRWTLWLVTFGRWMCIPFSLIAAWTCYLWGRDLYGERSGLVAMLLWCFSPMILGHAALMTPDAPAAALGALACYTFWRWLKKPTWHSTFTAGIILGLAELTKTTLILFYPLWPILWLAYRWSEYRSHLHSPLAPRGPRETADLGPACWFMVSRRALVPVAACGEANRPGLAPNWRREACMLIVRMLIGLYIVNLGYLGNGSFVQLKEYEFRSNMFGLVDATTSGYGNRFRESWLGEVPVPLPCDYMLGIDHQQRDFENFWGPSYLRGEFKEQGWWYYYCYAVLVKTPVGTMGLAILVLTTRLFRFRSNKNVATRDEWILLFPMLFVFVVVSSKWGFSHHLRYIFPCFPLAFIWLGQIARYSLDLGKTHQPHIPSRPKTRRLYCLFPILWIGCLTWTLGSSLYHYPHSLSYFNELVGGPRNGAKHLLNSNIDWGQDLLHLEKWISRQNDRKPVYLAFDSSYCPFVFGIVGIEAWPFVHDSGGIEFDASFSPHNGLFAISINQLYEFPLAIRDRDGSRYSIDKKSLGTLRNCEPVGKAGNSIYIFTSDQIRKTIVTSMPK
jgi:hypothetical protein